MKGIMGGTEIRCEEVKVDEGTSVEKEQRLQILIMLQNGFIHLFL